MILVSELLTTIEYAMPQPRGAENMSKFEEMRESDATTDHVGCLRKICDQRVYGYWILGLEFEPQHLKVILMWSRSGIRHSTKLPSLTRALGIDKNLSKQSLSARCGKVS
jgi:hypothetical protein